MYRDKSTLRTGRERKRRSINVLWLIHLGLIYYNKLSPFFKVKCPLHLAACENPAGPLQAAVFIIKYSNKRTQKWPWMTHSLWCKFWLYKTTHDARANKDVPCSLLPCQLHWWNLQSHNSLCGIFPNICEQSGSLSSPLMHTHLFLSEWLNLKWHQID